MAVNDYIKNEANITEEKVIPDMGWLQDAYNDNTTITSPNQIAKDYTDEDLAAYQASMGGGSAAAYSNLLFPNANQDLLKGNYQGSVVGSVPIFTAKDNVSPLAMMAYRRDQLRAASYKILQDRLKPTDWEIPVSSVEPYNDALRENFVGGMKYWDSIATEITRKTGQDGWKVLESGKTEYGIMYRNFLSSSKGLADGIDYVAAYANRSQELKDKGFYAGIDVSKNIEEFFAGAKEYGEANFSKDIGSSIKKLGVKMNFNSVLYDAINTAQMSAFESYKADTGNTTADFQAWKNEHKEWITPEQAQGIAQNLMQQYPDLVKSQDISDTKIMGWIDAYTGSKVLETLQVAGKDKGTTVNINQPDNVSPIAADTWLSLDILAKGNEVIGNKGTAKQNGDVVEFIIDGKKYEVGTGNMDAITDYMLQMKGYTPTEIAAVKVNMRSSEQSDIALSFNTFGTDNASKATSLQAVYSANINNPKLLFDEAKKISGAAYSLPNTNVLKLNTVEQGTDTKSGSGKSDIKTLQFGIINNEKRVSGAIIPQSYVKSANSVEGTIDFGNGEATYDTVDGYIVVPDAQYVDDPDLPYYTIRRAGEKDDFEFGDKTIKIPKSEVNGYVSGAVNTRINSLKTNTKIGTGVVGTSNNVTGKEDLTAKFQYVKLPTSDKAKPEEKALLISAYNYALNNKDKFKDLDIDWKNITQQDKRAIAIYVANAGGSDFLNTVEKVVKDTDFEYKNLFGL